MDGASAEVVACVEGVSLSQRTLLGAIADLTDADARCASLLPGWSVGHVLTHVARNADSHTRMLTAALAGEATTQYDGGAATRSAGIEAGAQRSAAELIADVESSSARLERTYDQMTAAAWAGHGVNAGGDVWPCVAMPFHRWREVELHHVDLGLGYTAADWPAGYLQRELRLCVELLPERLDDDGRRSMLAWLVGRGGQPASIDLAPWRGRSDHYPR